MRDLLRLDAKDQYLALPCQGLAWGGVLQKAIITEIGIYGTLNVSREGMSHRRKEAQGEELCQTSGVISCHGFFKGGSVCVEGC